MAIVGDHPQFDLRSPPPDVTVRSCVLAPVGGVGVDRCHVVIGRGIDRRGRTAVNGVAARPRLGQSRAGD